jgi:hypothetical protein
MRALHLEMLHHKVRQGQEQLQLQRSHQLSIRVSDNTQRSRTMVNQALHLRHNQEQCSRMAHPMA